jgi:regulator of protease activity HflC (stomatin/prohibitin superfamily)
VIVHPGEVGVEYKLFFQGTVTDYLYPEGIHFLWPWNRMYIYNTRVQETKETLAVLTKDGLEVEIGLSIRYRPERAMIGVLHQTVGPDYEKKIAIPEVESAVRTSAGEMTIQELYEGRRAASRSQDQDSTETTQHEDATLIGAINKAVDQASKRYVLIDNVIITRIKLPDYVQAAIQKKIEQEEVALAQEYRLRESRTEVDIATEQARRNHTLSESLTPQLLQLKGIEATEKLAVSPNSKVVVVGNGASSLPVILAPEK